MSDKDGKVIMFLNRAGGVGKTTFTFNTAWELSKTSKVLIIDVDPQEGNVSFRSGIERDEDSDETSYNVLQKHKQPQKCIQNVKNNLDIIPANLDAGQISQDRATIATVQHIISNLRKDYDYILIDNNPEPTWRHFLSLSCANFILVPLEADPKCLEGSNGMIKSILQAKNETNNTLVFLGFVVNKYKYTVLERDTIEELKKKADLLKTKVFKCWIRDCVVFKEAELFNKAVTEYSPKSNASIDFQEFIKEFKKEIKKYG